MAASVRTTLESSRLTSAAPAAASNRSSAPSILRFDDPVSASFQLFSLVNSQDRALEQAQAIESYILRLTETIVRDASKGGHVGHGLLLLNRKCVAEGVRQVFVQLAIRKWRQVRAYYNYIRNMDQEDTLPETDMDESHDHEVTTLARGLSMECCAFQRQC